MSVSTLTAGEPPDRNKPNEHLAGEGAHTTLLAGQNKGPVHCERRLDIDMLD